MIATQSYFFPAVCEHWYYCPVPKPPNLWCRLLTQGPSISRLSVSYLKSPTISCDVVLNLCSAILVTPLPRFSQECTATVGH